MAEVLEAAPPTICSRDETRHRAAIEDAEEKLSEIRWFEQEFGLNAGEVDLDKWIMDLFTLPSTMLHCQEARLRVDSIAGSVGMNEAARSDIMLAVGEAVANAVEHGNGNDPSRSFTVRCLAAPGRVFVSISDEGPGFCPDELPSIEEAMMLERGRGIHCMTAVMDKVRFEFGHGTTVRMAKLG
ncbi:MAG: ATP-binding protein [Armatimonadota bacterium]